jgi:phosphomethylpyrimidine synthase
MPGATLISRSITEQFAPDLVSSASDEEIEAGMLEESEESKEFAASGSRV